METKRFTTVDELLEDLMKPGAWYEEAYWAVWRWCDAWISPKTWYYRIKRGITWIQWGFNPKDIWSLDYTTAKWILPRLKRLKETKQGYPIIEGYEDIFNNIDATEEEMQPMYDAWDEIMNKMILAFELVIKDDMTCEEDSVKIQEGLDLFAKYFRNLWD